MQAPGFMPRLKLFLTSNVAEINSQPVLPELKSPHFKWPAAELFNRVTDIIELLGWKIENSDQQTHTLHAVATTPLFKFKDDITLSVLTDGENSYLIARSSSRVGQGDLAANSHHLQQLLEQLEAPDQ